MRNFWSILIVLLVILGIVFLVKSKKTGEVVPAPVVVGSTWVWEKTAMPDGSAVTPKQATAFTLVFSGDDSRVVGTTDCNGFSGSYTTDDAGAFGVSQLASTKKFCADSQETVFTADLAKANKYSFNTEGHLVLGLDNGGEMHFMKQ